MIEQVSVGEDGPVGGDNPPHGLVHFPAALVRGLGACTGRAHHRVQGVWRAGSPADAPNTDCDGGRAQTDGATLCGVVGIVGTLKIALGQSSVVDFVRNQFEMSSTGRRTSSLGIVKGHGQLQSPPPE